MKHPFKTDLTSYKIMHKVYKGHPNNSKDVAKPFIFSNLADTMDSAVSLTAAGKSIKKPFNMDYKIKKESYNTF